MFPERNDSFDFIQGLENFKKAYRAEKGLDVNDHKKPVDAKVAANLGLQDGEKMTLNIAGITKTSGPGAAMGNQTGGKKLGGGLKKLAPPPGFKGKAK